jgi:hypothetical protein
MTLSLTTFEVLPIAPCHRSHLVSNVDFRARAHVPGQIRKRHPLGSTLTANACARDAHGIRVRMHSGSNVQATTRTYSLPTIRGRHHLHSRDHPNGSTDTIGRVRARHHANASAHPMAFGHEVSRSNVRIRPCSRKHPMANGPRHGRVRAPIRVGSQSTRLESCPNAPGFARERSRIRTRADAGSRIDPMGAAPDCDRIHVRMHPCSFVNPTGFASRCTPIWARTRPRTGPNAGAFVAEHDVLDAREPGMRPPTSTYSSVNATVTVRPPNEPALPGLRAFACDFASGGLLAEQVAFAATPAGLGKTSSTVTTPIQAGVFVEQPMPPTP